MAQALPWPLYLNQNDQDNSLTVVLSAAMFKIVVIDRFSTRQTVPAPTSLPARARCPRRLRLGNRPCRPARILSPITRISGDAAESLVNAPRAAAPIRAYPELGAAVLCGAEDMTSTSERHGRLRAAPWLTLGEGLFVESARAAQPRLCPAQP